MSSHSSHHPQEVLLAQSSLYVHKGGLKPDSFHFQAEAFAHHQKNLLCRHGGIEFFQCNAKTVSVRILRCLQKHLFCNAYLELCVKRTDHCMCAIEELIIIIINGEIKKSYVWVTRARIKLDSTAVWIRPDLAWFITDYCGIEWEVTRSGATYFLMTNAFFNNNYCHTVYLSFIDDIDYVYFMFSCLLQLISEWLFYLEENKWILLLQVVSTGGRHVYIAYSTRNIIDTDWFLNVCFDKDGARTCTFRYAECTRSLSDPTGHTTLLRPRSLYG